MKSGKSRLYTALLSALAALPVVVQAGPASVNPAIADLRTSEAPRITRVIDDNVLTVVSKSHLAMLDNAGGLKAVPDSLPMNHMQLVLKRSPQRQAALDGMIAAQHDPHSPKFHHWVTPAEFGSTFGVHDADIAAATSWLESHGFTVNGVYPNRMQIDFSGNAGMVKRAFHVQEYQFKFNKEDTVANNADMSLPSALKDVVAGVAGLNSVHPQKGMMTQRVAQLDPTTKKINVLAAPKPPTNDGIKSQAISFVNGARGLVPYDLQKMYGVDKLHAAGLTGQGITIAVVEDGSMVPADWTNFVAQFNLGHYNGTFNQIQPQAFGPGRINCMDPTEGGTISEDDGETLLDAEWSTAMAPSANIVVASCGDRFTKTFWGGVYVAVNNLVNNIHHPDVISASYGYGEYFVDSASKAATDQIWAQADAEGISAFVSSGDSGSNPSFNGSIINSVPAIDANSFGTSPNVTVVGGTDTADVLEGTTAKYFNTTQNKVYGTAKGYVPEIPWNQSCGNSVAAKAAGYASAIDFCKAELAADPLAENTQAEAGSGGPSHIDPKPAWQSTILGWANDGWRDVPDVSLFAGSYNGDTWVIVCTSFYPCAPGFPGLIAISGGTSLASPMMAGIQALVDEGLAAQGLGQDQGNAAPMLYALAQQEYGAAGSTPPASLAACNSEKGGPGTAGCVFHNVTKGSISSNCIQHAPSILTPDCYFFGKTDNLFGFYGPFRLGLSSTSTTHYEPAYAAQPGWSFAAGLGSVDAANLLTAWATMASGN